MTNDRGIPAGTALRRWNSGLVQVVGDLPQGVTAWFWGHRGRTVVLAPGLSVDAAGDRIVCVEVHNRPTLKDALSLPFRANPESGQR